MITSVPSGTTSACGSSNIYFLISSVDYPDWAFPDVLFSVLTAIGPAFSCCPVWLVLSAVCASSSSLYFYSNCLSRSCNWDLSNAIVWSCVSIGHSGSIGTGAIWYWPSNCCFNWSISIRCLSFMALVSFCRFWAMVSSHWSLSISACCLLFLSFTSASCALLVSSCCLRPCCEVCSC